MLKGFDLQTVNVIVQDCKEVVASASGVRLDPLGLYIIRGSNM